MQISLALTIIGALLPPVASFAPALVESQKKMLKLSATADPQTIPLGKDLNDTWVVEDFSKGPADWFPEKASGSSKTKVFDWFSTVSQTFSPDDSLLGKQVADSQPPQDLPDCDWFANSIPDSTPLMSTISSQPVNGGPSDWFAQAIASFRGQGSEADWFENAIKSGNLVQPEPAPLLRPGPSSSFGQATSAQVQSKGMEAPCVKPGVSEWFSQAIKEAVEPPMPSNPRTAGPNEWFSQEIPPHKSEYTRVSKGLPQGPSEWFAGAVPSTTSSRQMTPHEWFSVQEVAENAPVRSMVGTDDATEPPHEWFTYVLENLK